MTELKFVSMGHGHVICANKIWAVVRTDTAQSKRLIRNAKLEGSYFDWTARRPMKSILLLDDGSIIGSCFSVTTIYNRLCEACNYEVSKDEKLLEEENEN